MAQSTSFTIQFKGAISVKANTPISGDFGTNDVMVMKTSGVSVSVNGTDAFPISYDEVGYADNTATYVFTKDCTIAYGVLDEGTTVFPTQFKGAMSVKANTPISGVFGTNNIVVMKTHGVNISVMGKDAFPIDYDELIYVDNITTYVFTKDCVLAYGVLTSYTGTSQYLMNLLDLKAPLANPTFTGTVVLPSTTSIGTITNTELSYLDGVTSAIQTQLGAKAPLASPTFTGTVTVPTLAATTGTFSTGITTGTGSSWISQKTDTSVLIKETNTEASGYATYRAFIRSTNLTYTFTVGRLANSTMGFYGFLNTQTNNQTDFSAYMDFNGNWIATGNVTAYSDKKFKENIVNIDGALEKTLQLRGVYYNKINDENKTRKLGVIAQEIQEILPEVVVETSDNTLTVDYGNITALLIEAIKEQQQQIETLKREIVGLKNGIC